MPDDWNASHSFAKFGEVRVAGGKGPGGRAGFFAQKEDSMVKEAVSSESVLTVAFLGMDVGFGEISPSTTFKQLTGFSGSSALLALEEDGTKTLFVDARYTLQAQAECADCTVVTCSSASLNDATVQTWLRDHVLTTIAYDPRNVSVAQVETLKKIDSAWIHKMERFMSAASGVIGGKPGNLQIDDYLLAGAPREHKLAGLKEGLAADQAWLLTSPESIAWLFNLRSNAPFTPIFPSCALITKKETELCVPPDTLTLKAQTKLAEVHIRVHAAQVSSFAKMLKEKLLPGQRLLFDPETTSVAQFEAFREVPRIPAQDPTVEARCVKTEAEVATARTVHVEEGAAVSALLAQLKAPSHSAQTEGDVVCELETLRQKIPGYHGPSFASIVAFGANAAVVHYAPSNEGAHLGDGVLLMDVGGQYNGATTDLTRTIVLGEKAPDPEIVDRYTRVLKGHIALATAVFPDGTTGAQLDVLARQFLWQAGQDYAHGTGHGVGNFLAVHEGPFGFSKRCTKPLKPGMILSNEPGFYAPGRYGIRLENLMVVRPHSTGFLAFDVLTRVPFEPALVALDQLTSPEQRWLAAYHRRIVREVGETRLDAQTRAWLEATCRAFEFL